MSKDNLKILRTEGEKKMKKAVSGIMLMLLILSMLTLAINIRPVKSMQEPPVLEWDRTYGGIGSDKAYSLVKTNDGGYAVAGDTNSFGAGGSDFWLVKTDSKGNEQWNKTYGGTSDDYIGWLMALAYDGGYTLAGTTNSFGAGDYDFWLVKTDANGMMQWNRTYGGTNDESMCGMIQTDDGGYAMVGRTNSFGAGGYDCWFVKTDSSGNMQWNKTYGSQSYDEMAHAVVQTSDGAYALLGSNHTGYERNDVLLFRLDSNGDVEWNKTYNRSYQNDFGDSLVQNADGGFTIAGLASSSRAEEYDGWLFRTDANGSILWSKTYGGPATDQLESICLTDDGGYAIAGGTDSFGAGSRDFWLVKTDASGNMQWNKAYGGTGFDEARCIVETGNGGYAVAGETGSFGAGSDDFWLIKLAFPHGDLSTSSPDICFSDSNPSEGQAVTISARVHNVGERNLENILVRFLDGNVSIGEEQISFISHHSQVTASIDWTAEGEGFHLIKVVVDPDNTVDETDEDNNEATRSVLVGPWHFGGIVLTGSISSNETYPGYKATVYGNAIYNTTYGAGEPLAGAEVTVTIIGQEKQWVTHTIRTGDYNLDIVSPYSPGNYTVVVTVTDYTFWDSIEIKLTVQQSSAGVDLTLSGQDISFLPIDPIENDNVDITATIRNVRTDNATNVLVAFYDDDEPIGNRTIDLVPAGDSEDTTISWNATPWGWHTIKVMIDPENTTGEPSEARHNNEASRNIYVYPSLPDLTPTSIGFSDSTPSVNQTITISANVQNIGGTQANHVLVSFYDDGQLIGNTTIPWIPEKGESRTASINYSFPTSGWHIINATVDVVKNITEADEGNNWGTGRIYVHLPSADLALSSSDITFSNSTPTVGDTINIYATVHNIGETDAYNVTVEFFDEDTRIASLITIPRINANAQETVDVSWNATLDEWHRIKVVVDGNNTIPESNENNNRATRYIYVSPEVGADLYMDQTLLHSEDIIFSNTCPALGENVTIYATVHNIGEVIAQNVTVIFYVDDVQLGSPKIIPSVPVGGNETVSTRWIASQAGSHVLKVIVDAPKEKNKNNNVATRAIIVGKHDVAVMNVTASKTVVGQGYSLNINLTAANQGDYTETFNVTVYVNSTSIALQSVTIAGASSTNILFSWNTSGFAKGNYTIWAYAWPVQGETDLADNNCTGITVTVSWLGDLNGDFRVDENDLWHFCGAFIDYYKIHVLDPNCDFNSDYKIDEDDLWTMAAAFIDYWKVH